MTSRITLCTVVVMYNNKKPGTSFKWSLVALYRWSLYREKFDLKT